MALPLSFIRTRRLFLGGLVLFVLVLLFLTVSSLLQPTKEQTGKTKTDQELYDKTVNRVFIKDFHTYGDYFSPQKQLAVENALYTYAHASSQDSAPDLYTGVVRQNSFLQTNDPNGVMTTKFLVDINPVNVTYILQVTGTTKDGAMPPVLIQCAPRSQQQSSSVTCADGMQTRE